MAVFSFISWTAIVWTQSTMHKLLIILGIIHTLVHFGHTHVRVDIELDYYFSCSEYLMDSTTPISPVAQWSKYYQ